MCQHIEDPKYYVQSLAGKQVFKDECTLCFHSSKNEKGLDLCLTCFNGSCPDAAPEKWGSHTELHYGTSGHSVFLNVHKNVKIVKGNTDNVTKLAIGVEGGVGVDLEEITYNYLIKCVPCHKSIDVPGEYANLVKSIEEHKTAYDSVQLQTWELEVKPCDHSRQLLKNQQVESFKVDISRCSDCEMSVNLWLCLLCGNLGCGRKNFDGTGGNGHGVAHYNVKKHPLAVKTGTISGSDQPSVYCYICDDDVSVPDMETALRKFGIDQKRMKKTEKTINEMSLEYNMNLKLSKSFEENQNLIPLEAGTHPKGIHNIGNSCYINSVLQSLGSTEELSKVFGFQNEDVKKHVLSHTANNAVHSHCLQCQLAKLATYMPIHTVEEIKPYMFRNLVGKNHVEFQTRNQQDAAEYLTHLFKRIEPVEAEFDVAYTKLFEFHAINELTCLTCQTVLPRKSKGTILDVRIPPLALPTIIAAPEDKEVGIELKNVFVHGIQLLPESVRCPNCKVASLCSNRLFLDTYPKYLVLKLQNFVIDNFQAKKLNVRYNFDIQSVSLKGLSWSSELSTIEPHRIGDLGSGPQVNEEALGQLMVMGFSRAKCIKALTETNNSVENAINLLFSMDADSDMEIETETEPTNAQAQTTFDQIWDMVSDWGLDKDYVGKVTSHYQNKDAEFVINYLMEHSQDDGLIPTPIPKSTNNSKDQQIHKIEEGSATYQPIAAVVHLGKSVNVGHYVSYCRRNINGEDTWVYYNDESAFKSEKPELGKGYLLFLKKIG